MRNQVTQKSLIDWDGRIRQGQMAAVRAELTQISSSEIPNALRAEMGHLLIRVGLPHRAISLLSPAVRRGAELRQEASTDERLAYALALAKIGSSREATMILTLLPPSVPEGFLYRGYICQTQWNYVEAIPFIRKYLELSKREPYELAIARVNLLACLINAQELAAGEKLLAELREEAVRGGWHLIKRHLFELEAQLAMGRNDWGRAGQIVQDARAGRTAIESISDLLLAKWSAWIMAHQGQLDEGVRAIEEVRSAARTMLHWETIRECDRMRAELIRDPDLLARVYAGSPYESFRAKLKERCGGWAEMPQAYLLGDAQGAVLDLQTGHLTGAREELKPGQVIHRCLSLVFRDFYRPITVGQLFADLFPNQYFDPQSSTNRVYNVIRRVRSWAEANGLPLNFEASDHAYTMSPWDKGFGVLLSLRGRDADLEIEGRLTRIRSQVGLNSFTSDDVAVVLGVSRSSAVRLLNRAVEAGALSRQGTHRATLYRWAG